MARHDPDDPAGASGLREPCVGRPSDSLTCSGFLATAEETI